MLSFISRTQNNNKIADTDDTIQQQTVDAIFPNNQFSCSFTLFFFVCILFPLGFLSFFFHSLFLSFLILLLALLLVFFFFLFCFLLSVFLLSPPLLPVSLVAPFYLRSFVYALFSSVVVPLMLSLILDRSRLS